MSDVSILQARPEDVPAIVRLQFASYPRLAAVNAWTAEEVEAQIRAFPEGQFVADRDGEIVGHCANLIVDGERALRAHSYEEITSHGTFANHDPRGDTLYGAEVMVHPSQRRKGIGSGFYRRRFEFVRERRLRRFVSGGRLPGYTKYRGRFSPEAYVRAVLDGELNDRTLSMQLRTGLAVRGLLRNYLRDPNSGNHASLLVWENPDGGSDDDVIRRPPAPTPDPLGPNPRPGDFQLRP